MAASDRQRWDAKFDRGEKCESAPSESLLRLAPWIPSQGRALEIAGGAGRHAIWLARRGLDVTLADISTVALQIAAERATAAVVSLQTLSMDLEEEPLPAGPWDVILSCYFLYRPLFREFPGRLAPGGVLVVVQPTRTNLERHDKPPFPYLLEDGELPGLVADLETLHYEEGWLSEGRHEAVLVARRRFA